MSSDICTTDNFCDNFIFLSSYCSKSIEGEKGRERVKT